jgi:hypothetical protein
MIATPRSTDAYFVFCKIDLVDLRRELKTWWTEGLQRSQEMGLCRFLEKYYTMRGYSNVKANIYESDYNLSLEFNLQIK